MFVQSANTEQLWPLMHSSMSENQQSKNINSEQNNKTVRWLISGDEHIKCNLPVAAAATRLRMHIPQKCTVFLVETIEKSQISLTIDKKADPGPVDLEQAF